MRSMRQGWGRHACGMRAACRQHGRQRSIALSAVVDRHGAFTWQEMIEAMSGVGADIILPDSHGAPSTTSAHLAFGWKSGGAKSINAVQPPFIHPCSAVSMVLAAGVTSMLRLGLAAAHTAAAAVCVLVGLYVFRGKSPQPRLPYIVVIGVGVDRCHNKRGSGTVRPHSASMMVTRSAGQRRRARRSRTGHRSLVPTPPAFPRRIHALMQYDICVCSQQQIRSRLTTRWARYSPTK